MYKFILSLLIFAEPLAAADFQPPAGCEAFLTVQSKGCEVSIYYRCSADPEGYQWRQDFGVNGKTYEALIDANGRWLQSKSFASGVSKILTGEEPDPASLPQLLKSGRDTMEFEQIDSEGVVHHYKGYDSLTGETVVLDGQPLLRSEFSFTEWDGEGQFVRQVRGNEYVSETFGRFFGGQIVVEEASGDSYPVDSAPIDFILPGEPGYGSTIPLYQCTDMMSFYHGPAQPQISNEKTGGAS
ncbi:MAG: hypothetical protein ABI459_00220 [Deltaproteobacteria bacterium]